MIDSNMAARKARNALLKAQASYEDMSGWWDPPPENVATLAIAQAVRKVDDVDWVTLEYNVRQT